MTPKTDRNDTTPGVRFFVRTAGIVLGITGIGKIWSACGYSKLLTTIDPVLGISFKPLLLFVGSAEIAVAGICFCKSKLGLAVGIIAWVATIFAVYRVGLSWLGWNLPCSCLGSVTAALHIPPQVADNIMKGVLAYLLVGSHGLLLRRVWRTGRAPRVTGG